MDDNKKINDRTGRNMPLTRQILIDTVVGMFIGGNTPTLAQIMVITIAFADTSEYPLYEHEQQEVAYKIYLRLI